jgi:hypothetical protein
MATATLLPTKKTPPTLTFEKAKVLLYGQPKIGKTTLAANLVDDVLVLACEPGLGGLSAYSVEIDSWDTFRKVGAELSETDKHSIVVIDTVDELYRMCADAVCQQLEIAHLADAEWGKGWQSARDEFRLRVGKMAGLGRGVWFISHAQETELRTRVGTRTRTIPTLDKRAFSFLEGFVDYILYAEPIRTTEEGEQRILRTAAAEEYIAGGRVALPDPLPLDAVAVRKAITDAAKPQKGGATK